MIIVLEGADGVGKTTLADAIESLNPGNTVRFNHGPPPDGESAAMHYEESIRDLVRASDAGTVVVCDRLHVGELVYGAVVRDDPGITVGEACVFDLTLEGAGALLVHCSVPKAVAFQRMIGRDGGKPDEKSGAKTSHWRALAAGFRRYTGGVLTGHWRDADLTGYPLQAATELSIEARMRHRFGPPVPKFQLALPDPEPGISNTSWICHQMRILGLHRQFEFATPGHVRNNVPIIALGDASAWLDVAAIAYERRVPHREDEEDYDEESAWRSEVFDAVKCVKREMGHEERCTR